MTEAMAAYELADRHHHQWHIGEFSFWRWRAGEKIALPKECATPFALQIGGDWKSAAQAWRDLGCPYEEAKACSKVAPSNLNGAKSCRAM